MSENSRYQQAINEASYKQNIRNISNTDRNLAWFEETGETFPRVDASNIWQDYKYIRDNPEDAASFYVSFGDEKVLVWKRYDQIELTKQDGYRALYKNDLFSNIIIKENYPVYLYDANKEQIPFGLKKWSYDPNNGYLSFIDGLPEGYDCSKLYVTFYRYEGRMLLDAALTSDGETALVDGYEPKKDQSIATKKYVDNEISKIQTTLDLMKPPVPQTMEGQKLTAKGDYFRSYDASSGDACALTAFPDTEFSVISERVLNPGDGNFELVLNDYVYESVDLKNPKDTAHLKVMFNNDFYFEIYASRGFYKGIQVKFSCRYEDLPPIFTQNEYLKVRFRISTNKSYYTSDELLIGLEPAIRYSGSPHIKIKPENVEWKYVSGVPTIAAGSTLRLFGYKNNTLKNFKSNNEIGKLSALNAEILTMPKNAYSVRFPIHEVSEAIEVPEDYYNNESFAVSYESYDILGNINHMYEEQFRCRIDTVSDESNRVTSGKGLLPVSYGSAWNPKARLESNELQVLNGRCVWPEKDFSQNGNVSPITQFDGSWIQSGPNYSSQSKTGIRYISFKYDMPVSNGVFVSIPDLLQNAETHAYKTSSMQIKVEGATGWLNALKAYKGVCRAVKDEDGCLAVQDSSDGKVYCTFGSKPLSGSLILRIGRRYEEKDFTVPKVAFHI